MLSAYFDDSGTHEGSSSVVWGGLLGSTEDFTELEGRWCNLLAEPLPGKPPLAEFHLSDCVSARGEFLGWSRAEIDRVRYLFRDAIVQSPVMALAYAVDSVAWDRVAPGTPLEQIDNCESCAFGLCVREAMKIEESGGNGLALYFDQGRQGIRLEDTRRAAWLLLPDAAKTSTFAFRDVKNSPALQAADTVANEFYRFTTKYFGNSNHEPDPHFRNFLEKLANLEMGVMREGELIALSRKMSWKPSE